METKTTQLSKSNWPSLTNGKDLYLASPKTADLTPDERKTLKAMSTAKSLDNLQKQDVSQLTVETCFKGTNVKTALKVDEVRTRVALVAMINRTVKFIDANKTLSTPEEVELTINELIQSFPCYTLEDWRLCCYMMAKEAFGPYYERLKLAQFVECFNKYEQLKQPVIQTIRDNERKDYEREQAEALRYLQTEYATQINPVAKRVNAADWMRGEDRLTYTEREEMKKREQQKS
jgi:hypothetical protein